MKKTLLIFLASLITFSCATEPQNKNLNYKNIIILSDMSSRLDNKREKDSEEIMKIIDRFKTECVRPGEKIGDKSSISFSVFSDKIAALIDIDKIKNLGEKQQFINSTGKYKNNGLDKKLNEFKQTVKNVYENKRNNGLDLLSLLIEKIENEPIIKPNKYLTNGIDTTYINFDNNIYVFTDGYLEYMNKETNNQFYFGESEINKLRNYCLKNKIGIEEALQQNTGLGLPPYPSKKNKLVNLHILETHERDKNEKKQTYNNPTGLRDNEILESVWHKWTIESGFKSFDWKKY